MGAYLSQPITDKEVDLGENASLQYAVSAMQGWRTDMEDAHICALDIDRELSVFGVFDGHGGKEVAKFVALHLIEELMKTKGFREKDIPSALKDCYLGLDSLIRSERSREELLQLANGLKPDQSKSSEYHQSNTYERIRGVRRRVIDVDHLPKMLRDAILAARSDPQFGDQYSSESDFTEGESSDDEADANIGSFPIVISDSSGSDSETELETPYNDPPAKVRETIGGNHREEDSEDGDHIPLEPSVKLTVVVSHRDAASEAEEQKAGLGNNEEEAVIEERERQEAMTASDSTDSAECRSSEGTEQHESALLLPECKHSDTPVEKPVTDNSVVFQKPSRSPQSKAVKCQKERRSKSMFGGFFNFVCPLPCLRTSAVLPAEDPLYSPSYSSITTTESSTTSPSKKPLTWDPLPSIGNKPENQKEDDDLMPDSQDPGQTAGQDTLGDENGREVTVAGCTAVVAVISKDTLFVANAGDSRCVLCHDGIALPMSRDHKPTDPEEYVRIKNAGGFVSDGRVNGCLNLSRALGDMEYKKSPNLAPEEYMITANPDIKTMDLQSGDQFLILACDGIWDVLSDQEACDFVNSRLAQNYSLLSIAEELCDFCLAEDADGSGEGCDNMTAMVVMLKDYSQ